MSHFARRTSIAVKVGDRIIGGNSPILVQSMTNTPTEDANATAAQVKELFEAGSEIVRVTVNTKDAAVAIPKIVDKLNKSGCNVPIVGDFHYNGHLLLEAYPECARSLAKYRINPGNVGRGEKHDENFKSMIAAACRWNKPVRIGVNWGSLDQELLAKMMDENAKSRTPLDAHEVLIGAIVESALQSARLAESYGLSAENIILSAKVSEVPDLIDVYRRLASRCDYALHLGLTEAGMGAKGIVSSTAALSVLLAEGIGDTIRVSLTPTPGGARTEEVEICQHILQSLKLRTFAPRGHSVPRLRKNDKHRFQELAQQIQQHLSQSRAIWKDKYPGSEQLKVAVMGCIVNGPGESKYADIGISLPGSGEEPRAPVYIDGKHATTLQGPTVAEDFIKLVESYVDSRFIERPVSQTTAVP